MSQHDNLRDNIGQALSDVFKAIGPIDDCNSEDIDQLADAVVAILPGPPIEAMSDDDLWHLASMIATMSGGSLYNISANEAVASMRAGFMDPDTGRAFMKDHKNVWKEAVLDQCAITHMPLHEDDPKKTIDGVINWYVQVALDPAVSETQAALVADSRRMDFLDQRGHVTFSLEQVEISFDVDPKLEGTNSVRELVDHGALQV